MMNTAKNAELMPARAQNQMCLILGLFKVPCACLDVYRDAGMYSLNAKENGKGDDYEVVLVLPEHAADLFHPPYHREFVVADTNRLPNGIHAEKEFPHKRVADQANIGAMFGFG
jgi:hypothetical protein